MTAANPAGGLLTGFETKRDLFLSLCHLRPLGIECHNARNTLLHIGLHLPMSGEP
jgi:hypothetical protein